MKTITYDDTQWQLVPKEPTQEMYIAACDPRLHTPGAIRNLAQLIKEEYEAMLAEAPTPPAMQIDEWYRQLLSECLHAPDYSTDVEGNPMDVKTWGKECDCDRCRRIRAALAAQPESKP